MGGSLLEDAKLDSEEMERFVAAETMEVVGISARRVVSCRIRQGPGEVAQPVFPADSRIKDPCHDENRDSGETRQIELEGFQS